MKLELLAPAKDYAHGQAAIDHGADAVYIGAPAYGARAAATNSIDDIERLARYAHLFRCKVFATVNTLLFDDETEEAVKMCHKLYEAGCDALIIQDLGLLECDLPPIELHASTQMHNTDVQRIQFLEKVGFKRVILARETSLEEIATIRKSCDVELESFVHGALCVSYSGQCYMSQYLNNRSGNRGCCSQPCRSTYSLENGQGQTLVRNAHLLSLKDFSAAQHIGSMIDAGITSFKIEGRLKDIGYVKNITAYYRSILDEIMTNREGAIRASSGRSRLYFTPDPYKSFNRGFTDYFLRGRQPMASFSTQKSLGKPVGTLAARERNRLTIATYEETTTFHTGDGLCYTGERGETEGFLVNQVHGNVVVPNKEVDIAVGTKLWRNNDYMFEKQLAGRSADRKIDVDIILSDTSDGIAVEVIDEDGNRTTVERRYTKTVADKEDEAARRIETQLGKTGGTPYSARSVETHTAHTYFIPSALLNEMRREALERLSEARLERYQPHDDVRIDSGSHYHKQELDYRGNVINSLAAAFYRRHGVEKIEWGLERSKDYDGKALMTTRYCLRYELGQCLQHKCNKEVAAEYKEPLYLVNQGNRLRLVFDCENCQMIIKAR